MRSKAFTRSLLRVVESITAIGLVLVCFLFLLGVLDLSFPEGTTLTELMQAQRYQPPELAGARLDANLGEEKQAISGFAALLSAVLRDVKEKKAGSIAWEVARKGIPLRDRHAVQSFSQSGATITFDKANDLQLGENSLVVVRALKRDLNTRRRTATLVVVEGELDGRFEGVAGEALAIEVATAKSTIRLSSNKGKPANFKVAVSPDQSSTYSVYDGVAEIIAAERTVRLEPNHSITVDSSGQVGLPVRLPGVPEPVSPAHDSLYAFRSARPRVHFAWTPQDLADGYRLALARDPEFREIVYQTKIAETEHLHGNLPEGRYFWRVSGLNGTAESPAGPVRELAIVRDTVPPQLRVSFPEGSVRAGEVLLRGETEPGSEIFIGDAKVDSLDSGEFEYAMRLDRGMNVVVVEAIDSAGNTTYESQIVRANF